jgi:hypothetical protein
MSFLNWFWVLGFLDWFSNLFRLNCPVFRVIKGTDSPGMMWQKRHTKRGPASSAQSRARVSPGFILKVQPWKWLLCPKALQFSQLSNWDNGSLLGSQFYWVCMEGVQGSMPLGEGQPSFAFRLSHFVFPWPWASCWTSVRLSFQPVRWRGWRCPTSKLCK